MNIEALARPRGTQPELHCLLVGGPADGERKREWSGAQRVVVSAHSEVTGAGGSNSWAIYRRSDPEIISPHGDVEFHFFSTHFSVT